MGNENAEMLMSQASNLRHHIEELVAMLSKRTEVEPWVITKAQRAVTDIADITHYLEGERHKSRKYADGGQLTLFADGGMAEDPIMGVGEDEYGTFEMMKHGGEVQVSIVNEGEKFDRDRYKWLLGDADKDTIENVDDHGPTDPADRERVDSPPIGNAIAYLIDLKGKMDDNMYAFVDDLKDVAPDGSKIYARTKTPYSILNKLITKRLLNPKTGLTDLIGTTITTKDKKELDMVRDSIGSGRLGKVIEFEDMYASPKAGYRAYHFLVERNGMPVEVQLKTKRQKAVNELSHEPYKMGRLNGDLLLKVSKMADDADNGDAEAVKQFNEFMAQPNLDNVFYMAEGGMTDAKYQIVNKDGKYYAPSMNRVEPNFHISPDMGYTYSLSEAEALRDKMEEIGYEGLRVVMYDNNWWKKENGGMMARGGKLLANYRDDLEAMTDDELAQEVSNEIGIDADEVMENIDNDRDDLIDELLFRFKQNMMSRGEMSDGGMMAKGGTVKKGKVTLLSKLDHELSDMYFNPRKMDRSVYKRKQKEYEKEWRRVNGGTEKYPNLFEYYILQPLEIRPIIKKWMDKYDEGTMDYKDTRKFRSELQAVGYTFDFDLDNQPYALRPKGVKLSNVFGEEEGFSFAMGGETEEGVDLFEDPESIPDEVHDIIDEYLDMSEEEQDYKALKEAQQALEKIGYTFDYGLDGVPYNLRKIGQKGKHGDEYEGYAKGGRTKWIQKAIKKPGALRATAKREGLIKGEEKLSASDLAKLEAMGGKTAQRARLAKTLRSFGIGGEIEPNTAMGDAVYSSLNTAKESGKNLVKPQNYTLLKKGGKYLVTTNYRAGKFTKHGWETIGHFLSDKSFMGSEGGKTAQRARLALTLSKYADGGHLYPDLSAMQPGMVNEPSMGFDKKKTEADAVRLKAKIKSLKGMLAQMETTDKNGISGTIPEVSLVMADSGVTMPDKKIQRAFDAVDILHSIWDTESLKVNESMYVLLLNQANKVIGYAHHSKGGITGTVLDRELIIAMAVKALAKGVIVAHNHPSGNLIQSIADEKVSRELQDGLKSVGITLLDSIIVVPNSKQYLSLSEQGII